MPFHTCNLGTTASSHVHVGEDALAVNCRARSFEDGTTLVHDEIAVRDALGKGEILFDYDECRTSGFLLGDACVPRRE